MKSVTLFHNPQAGDQDHAKNELVSLIESHGYNCRYYSTNGEGFKRFDTDTDLLVIAGGDGTVVRILKMLITRGIMEKYPVIIFPMGTANNIFKSLGISKSLSEQIGSWETAHVKPFDVLKTSGNVASMGFKSVGLGSFTDLTSSSKGRDDKHEPQAEKRLARSLNQLCDIVSKIPAKEILVEIDGIKYSGEFICVEIVNIGSIGPQIDFSSKIDSGDGKLNVVLVRAEQRPQLLTLIKSKMNGMNQDSAFDLITGSRVNIQCQDAMLHIDDQLIGTSHAFELSVQVQPGMFQFLI